MRIFFSICKNFKFIPIATSNIPTTTSKKDKLSVLLTKKIIRRWIQQTVRSRSQQRQLRRLRKFNLITDTTKLIYFFKKIKNLNILKKWQTFIIQRKIFSICTKFKMYNKKFLQQKFFWNLRIFLNHMRKKNSSYTSLRCDPLDYNPFYLFIK